jgi:hypothetical protein
MLAQGQLLPTDFYWCPGMTDWKPMSTLAGVPRKLPFPRPAVAKPNLLDEVMSRQHRTEGLAMLWDLLASSPTECLVSEEDIQQIEAKTGVKVRSRCEDELKQWYQAAIADYLSDRLFTPHERINLRNLAQTFGFSADDVGALNKTGFAYYFKSALEVILARPVAASEKASQMEHLMQDLPLSSLDAATIRQDVLGDYIMHQVDQEVQKVGSDEVLSPEKAQPLHDLTKALGTSLEIFGVDIAKRVQRAEAAWQWYHSPLPEVSSALELGREKCYWTQTVELVENKRVTVRRSYGGFSASTSLFMGIRYRTGSYEVQRFTEDQMLKIDQGAAVFTDSRVIFSGAYKHFNFKYSKIIDITEWSNGVQISRDSGGDIYFIFPQGGHQAAVILRRLVQEAKGS